MDYLIVFLGTLLVVIIVYMLYTNYFSSTTQLSGEIDMKDKPADITVDKLTRPDASRYAYNIWIYIDKPLSSTAASPSKIFDRANDLGLFLDGNTSNLTLRLHRGRNTPANDVTYQLSNNFPLQKWVYITISVDNSMIDMYLDGKLVKSVIAEAISTVSHRPDAVSGITFGLNPGAYMTKFNRTLTPSDPQTAWSTYMDGSGSKMGLGNLANRYNVDLSIMKDSLNVNTIPLW